MSNSYPVQGYRTNAAKGRARGPGVQMPPAPRPPLTNVPGRLPQFFAANRNLTRIALLGLRINPYVRGLLALWDLIELWQQWQTISPRANASCGPAGFDFYGPIGAVAVCNNVGVFNNSAYGAPPFKDAANTWWHVWGPDKQFWTPTTSRTYPTKIHTWTTEPFVINVPIGDPDPPPGRPGAPPRVSPFVDPHSNPPLAPSPDPNVWKLPYKVLPHRRTNPYRVNQRQVGPRRGAIIILPGQPVPGRSPVPARLPVPARAPVVPAVPVERGEVRLNPQSVTRPIQQALHWLKPPREGVKERKVTMRTAAPVGMRFLDLVVGPITEGLDLLDVFYRALPKSILARERARRHGREPRPAVKAALVYLHADKLDLEAVYNGFLANELQDQLIGRMSSGARRGLPGGTMRAFRGVQ